MVTTGEEASGLSTPSPVTGGVKRLTSDVESLRTASHPGPIANWCGFWWSMLMDISIVVHNLDNEVKERLNSQVDVLNVDFDVVDVLSSSGSFLIDL